MSIPVIIVPILTEPERLTALLASIDHPVGKVIVIDNGGVVDPLVGGRNLMPFNVHVVAPGHNLGVSASWNLGIKCSPLAPWWLIVNHDITFGPGDLARLDETVEPRAAILYKMLGLAAFALTPPVLQAVGWFDEQIILGYDEDVDYCRRCDLAGVASVEVGFTGTHVGSATIMSDPDLRAWNAMSHPRNDAYYSQKWGGPKQGGETFDTPFDRKGHLGDWRLEINRLRDQTWPRSKL